MSEIANLFQGINPHLVAPILRAILDQRAQDMVHMADSYAEGEYSTAYRLVHRAFGRMSLLAAALTTRSTLVFPATVTAGATAP